METAAAPVSAPVSQPSAPSSSNTPLPQSSGSSQNTGIPQSSKLQEGAPQKAAPKPESQEQFEVKVNGKVVKMSRQQVIDYASMSHAANDKFNEAKKMRGEVDRIISTAKKNPIEALSDPALGLTRDQIKDAFEKWYMSEFVEPENLNEDQKKLRDSEAKLKKYEDEAREKKLKEEQDEEQKLTNQQRTYLQNQIVEAMEASGLPKTKFFASRMAFYMRQNLVNGWDAPLNLIVQQVKQERQDNMADLTQNSDGETLISLLGEGVVNKIRQHDLKKLRERRQANAPSFSAQNTNSAPSSNGKISSQEVQRRLREMRSGKKSF